MTIEETDAPVIDTRDNDDQLAEATSNLVLRDDADDNNEDQDGQRKDDGDHDDDSRGRRMGEERGAQPNKRKRHSS